MSQSGWYYTSNGQRVGPVSIEQLRHVGSLGHLGPRDLVWTEGMADWQPATAVPGLLPTAHPQGYYPQQGAPQQYGTPPLQYGGPLPPMQYQSGQPVGQSNQGMAIAGFVLSFFGPFSVLGLIFSLVALSGMKRTGNEEGKGLAIAGVVISSVVLSLFCLYVIGIASCFGAALR
jgi:hypothetical protein